MKNWDEIRTAYAVAKLGTVTAAAESLGMQRATVIRHIDQLENELGTKLFQRHGRGYTPTEMGNDLLQVAGTLMPIIRQKVKPDSVVYTDTFRSYNALDVSEFKHYRINHSELFVNKHNHINGIENFWNQAKRHLRRFNGVPRSHFHLFLKECEWRFNNSDPKSQLKQLNQWVKKEMGWLSRTAPRF